MFVFLILYIFFKLFFFLIAINCHIIFFKFIYGFMVKDHSDSERGNLLPPLQTIISD